MTNFFPLGDITELITKGTTPSTLGGGFMSSGINFIKVESISDGGVILKEKLAYIDEATHAKLARSILRKDDILFSIAGAIGRTTRVAESVLPANTNQALAIIRVDQSKACVDYVHQCVQGDAFIKTCSDKSVKSAQANVSLGSMAKARLYLPPLAEQRKIAEILRTWDEAIETAEAEIKAKQERKRWLAETVLSGSVRVKGHKTAWDKKRLDQIGKIVPGGTPSTSIPEYWNGDVPWVTPTEITKLKTPYIHITESLITSEGVRNSSAALLPVDSLIVCTRATVGVCAINKVPMTTNQGFKSIVPESTDDTLFLYYVLNSMQSTFNRLAQGSTFLEISKTQFEKMTIIWPEAEERRQIASLMRTADEQTEKIAERIESLRTQKRGLMQKLLTGEVRVAA